MILLYYLEKRLEGDFCRIMPLGDLHIGERNWNEKLLKKYLSYALENHIYLLGMGDFMNTATKTSVGKGPYDEEMTPTEQYKKAIALFRPLAEEGLLLGLLTGNHEERASKEGLDICEMLSDALAVPYFGYSVIVKFVVGRNAYVCFATHGHTGSQSVGGVANRLKKLNEVAVADLYLMGHTHQLLDFSDLIRTVDVRNNKVIECERVYVNTGSFLGYDGGYGDMKNFPLVKQGAPLITLSGLRSGKSIMVNSSGLPQSND